MTSRTEWDLTHLIPNFSSETLQQEQLHLTQVHEKFITKWKETDSFLNEIMALKEALEEWEELCSLGGVGGAVGYATGLYTVLDQTSPERRAIENRIGEFQAKLANRTSFFLIRLSKIPADAQKRFLAVAELARYTYFLKRLFEEGAHVLSEAEERIETLKGGVSKYKWVDMVAGLISDETRMLDEKELTFEELLTALRDPDKKTRDQAAAGVNDILKLYRKVAENEINAVLENKKIEDELRAWHYPESARLFSDDISKEVVDVMTAVVAEANTLAHECYALKAKLLKLPKLAYHERNLPVGEIAQTFSYEESYALVKKVMKGLDPEFASILEGFSEQGLIDVYPRKGKRGGAACWHNALRQPTYILLNHTNKIGDVLTLAHEVGHGINNELVKQKQSGLYFGTPTSTAEVASTFMEDFVLHELVQKANPDLRRTLLFQKLDDSISTIFRQVACYRFEQELHALFREKGYLSATEIGELFQKHMAAYMGPAIEQSEGSENWWIYWSHIRSHFYVYSYASGLLISMALQAKVRENPVFISNVKTFLSAGLAESPEDIFMKLGVNIADKKFWEQGIGEIRALLEEAKKTL